MKSAANPDSPAPGTLSAALAMIAALPLSDAEKAEAIRRLLAEQPTESTATEPRVL